MGQYYLLVNIDKKQKMFVLQNFGSKYTSGQKMLEQIFNLGVKPFLFLSLLEKPEGADCSELVGSWKGDRVVLLGDYADKFPFLTASENTKDYEDSDFYTEVGMDWHKKWLKGVDQLGSLLDYKVLNTTKNEYISVKDFESSQDPDVVLHNENGIMKAVYSTLFWTQETAGGDCGLLINGRWAGDRLKITKKVPEAAKDISDDIWTLLKKVDEC